MSKPHATKKSGAQVSLTASTAGIPNGGAGKPGQQSAAQQSVAAKPAQQSVAQQSAAGKPAQQSASAAHAQKEAVKEPVVQKQSVSGSAKLLKEKSLNHAAEQERKRAELRTNGTPPRSDVAKTSG